MYLANYEVA